MLSHGEIDGLAEDFLRFAYPDALKRPMGVPLATVVRRLREAGHCSFSVEDDLGFDSQGRPYLGHYSISRNHIAISALISPPDPRFPFTCAHEWGHFYLHRDVDFSALIEEGVPEIRDSSVELKTYRTDGPHRRSRLEWQANRFASALLLPRATVPWAVAFSQSKLGINRRGRIWLDSQPQNQQSYRAIVDRLASMYKVSKAAVRFRIQELDLLHTAPNYGLRPLGDTFATSLNELFGA